MVQTVKTEPHKHCSLIVREEVGVRKGHLEAMLDPPGAVLLQQYL